MSFLYQVLFAVILWVLSAYRRHYNEQREYQTGMAHGRAERYAELASWLNEHHPDLLKEFPPQ